MLCLHLLNLLFKFSVGFFIIGYFIFVCFLDLIEAIVIGEDDPHGCNQAFHKNF